MLIPITHFSRIPFYPILKAYQKPCVLSASYPTADVLPILFSEKEENTKATPPPEHHLIPLRAYYFKPPIWRISWESTWMDSIPLCWKQLSQQRCWPQHGARQPAIFCCSNQEPYRSTRQRPECHLWQYSHTLGAPWQFICTPVLGQ